MVCKFGLCDLSRNGQCIWLSSDGKLAAVSDNLGRVTLIDCEKSLALRVWKGYRDAQCCFIEVAQKLQRNGKIVCFSLYTLSRIVPKI